MTKNKVGVNVDDGIKKLSDMTIAVLSSNATINDDKVNDQNMNIYSNMPQMYTISDLLLLERQFGNVIIDQNKSDEFKYQAGDNLFSQIINIASKLIRVNAQEVIQNLQTFLSFIKIYFPPKFQDTWSNYISEIVRIASQNRTTNINELVDDGNFFNNMMLKIRQNPNYEQQIAEIKELVNEIRTKITDPDIRNALLRQSDEFWSPIQRNHSRSQSFSFDPSSVHSSFYEPVHSERKSNSQSLSSDIKSHSGNNSTLLRSALGDESALLRSAHGDESELLKSAMSHSEASPGPIERPEQIDVDRSK